MSERIKVLANEAWQYANNNSRDGDDTHGWLYRDKFAELMIEQFDRILVNEYLDCVGENDKKSQFRIDRLRNRIKEYFGVDTPTE